MATRKRIALTSQSEVPVMPPVCTNSLSSLGDSSHPLLREEPWEEEKREGQVEDHLCKRKRTNEETETPGEEGLRNGLFLPISSRARTVPGSLYFPWCYREQRVPGTHSFTPASARLWEGEF